MSIQIVTVNESLVVDSRLIAQELGIEHASLLKTIKKYLDRLGRKEPVKFEIDVVKRPQGGTYEISYCYLNEYQATLLMTFSRNTEQVLDCKEKLVEGFEKAKQLIKEVIPAQNDRIRELEMQLEISQNNRYILDKSEAIASLHGVEILALIKGVPNAIVPVKEVITETVVCKDGRNVSFVGRSLADMAKQLGFKTGRELEIWLKRQKQDHLICQGMRAVQAPYIPEENIKTVKDLFAQKRKSVSRQMLIGE
jgi:phage regulator Rha-like protein